jgi:hypothetical protein
MINPLRRIYRRYGICLRHRTAYRWACRRCQKLRYQ